MRFQNRIQVPSLRRSLVSSVLVVFVLGTLGVALPVDGEDSPIDLITEQQRRLAESMGLPQHGLPDLKSGEEVVSDRLLRRGKPIPVGPQELPGLPAGSYREVERVAQLPQQPAATPGADVPTRAALPDLNLPPGAVLLDPAEFKAQIAAANAIKAEAAAAAKVATTEAAPTSDATVVKDRLISRGTPQLISEEPITPLPPSTPTTIPTATPTPVPSINSQADQVIGSGVQTATTAGRTTQVYGPYLVGDSSYPQASYSPVPAGGTAPQSSTGLVPLSNIPPQLMGSGRTGLATRIFNYPTHKFFNRFRSGYTNSGIFRPMGTFRNGTSFHPPAGSNNVTVAQEIDWIR